jgi:hypothetical protein
MIDINNLATIFNILAMSFATGSFSELLQFIIPILERSAIINGTCLRLIADFLIGMMVSVNILIDNDIDSLVDTPIDMHFLII